MKPTAMVNTLAYGPRKVEIEALVKSLAESEAQALLETLR